MQTKSKVTKLKFNAMSQPQTTNSAVTSCTYKHMQWQLRSFGTGQGLEVERYKGSTSNGIRKRFYLPFCF